MMDWPGLYLIVKIVAVLFGVIAGAFVGKVLTPFVGNRRAGAALVVFCAALGGLALWLAVNRVGGKGPGNGPGPGGGDGMETGSPGASGKPNKQHEHAGASQAETLPIKMLGGEAVKKQRFYVLGGKPRDWAELVTAISEQKERDAALKTIEIVIYPESVDQDNPAVQRLVKWAKVNKLTVNLSFPAEGPSDRRKP